MHRTTSIIFVALGLFATTKLLPNNSNRTNSVSESNDSLLTATWNRFATAVLQYDVKAFKALSTDSIRCDECLTNTRTENSLLNDYKINNERTWYNDLYTKLCYISIAKFIQEDYELIFSDQIKSRLLDATKLHFIDNDHNSRLYSRPGIIGKPQKTKPDFKEVLLTTIDSTPTREGAQFAFAFVNVGGQFKFCGFSTIP